MPAEAGAADALHAVTGKRAPANDNLKSETLAAVQERLGGRILAVVWDRGQASLTVARADAHEVIGGLRDMGFDFFVDVTAIDYSEWPGGEYSERFAVIYCLQDLRRNERVRVKVMVPELDCKCPTMSDLFGGAEWGEREVYDMFGIHFTAHPDLRRLLCPDNMKGFPLRKDYPLTGRGEREDFPVYHDDQA